MKHSTFFTSAVPAHDGTLLQSKVGLVIIGLVTNSSKSRKKRASSSRFTSKMHRIAAVNHCASSLCAALTDRRFSSVVLRAQLIRNTCGETRARCVAYSRTPLRARRSFFRDDNSSLGIHSLQLSLSLLSATSPLLTPARAIAPTLLTLSHNR